MAAASLTKGLGQSSMTERSTAPVIIKTTVHIAGQEQNRSVYSPPPKKAIYQLTCLSSLKEAVTVPPLFFIPYYPV